jgi:hypothetical protein
MFLLSQNPSRFPKFRNNSASFILILILRTFNFVNLIQVLCTEFNAPRVGMVRSLMPHFQQTQDTFHSCRQLRAYGIKDLTIPTRGALNSVQSTWMRFTKLNVLKIRINMNDAELFLNFGNRDGFWDNKNITFTVVSHIQDRRKTRSAMRKRNSNNPLGKRFGLITYHSAGSTHH